MASPSVNKVIIAGNLTRDPELRHTGAGTSVASMSVAVNESYKNKDGEWCKNTMFFNVVVWNKQAEFVSKYCQKGTPVFVEGKLSNRSYETNAGEKRNITEIVASSVQSLAVRTHSDAGGGSDNSASGEKPAASFKGSSAGQPDLYGNTDDPSDDDAPPF